MKDRANIFFSIAIVGMVISLLSTNFDNPTVSTAYGEAEQTVFAEEGESSLPPLPLEEIVEAPLPDQEDTVDVEKVYEEFVEEANDVVVSEPVLIKEECKTQRRRLLGGTSRASPSYGLRIFRRSR
jgi:hypothetical protein